MSITLTRVKVGNIFENLLNEIHEIMYPLCQVKEIIKKVYNCTMNSKNT